MEGMELNLPAQRARWVVGGMARKIPGRVRICSKRRGRPSLRVLTSVGNSCERG